MRTKVVALSDKSLNKYVVSSGESNDEARNKMKKIINLAIQTELTEKQKLCLIEYYINGKKGKEIAEENNLNPSTVSRHIASAKRKLQRIASIYM